MKVTPWLDTKPESIEGFPGVNVRWVIGQPEGASRFAMRVFEVSLGAEIPLHEHWYEQEMYIRDGRGAVLADRGAWGVGPGDVVWISPRELHGFRNLGDNVLRFICCVPLDTESLDEVQTTSVEGGKQ